MMKANKIIREVMKNQNEKVASLADKLGLVPNVLSQRLTQENISTNKLDEMLRAMGYKIIVVPRDVREQEGWYRVE